MFTQVVGKFSQANDLKYKTITNAFRRIASRVELEARK